MKKEQSASKDEPRKQRKKPQKETKEQEYGKVQNAEASTKSKAELKAERRALQVCTTSYR